MISSVLCPILQSSKEQADSQSKRRKEREHRAHVDEGCVNSLMAANKNSEGEAASFHGDGTHYSEKEGPNIMQSGERLKKLFKK